MVFGASCARVHRSNDTVAVVGTAGAPCLPGGGCGHGLLCIANTCTAQSPPDDGGVDDARPDATKPACSADSECQDELQCTTGRCDRGACVTQIADGACLIDGACVDPGGVGPDNACQVCDSARSKTSWSLLAGCGFTFAGSGAVGHVDGPARWAAFSSPADIAVDTTGRVFVADKGNHRIRLITSGTVSTFAGTGAKGSDDGSAASATFYDPMGLALDAQNRLWVADAGNHRIRLVEGSGVSTVAGSVAGALDGTAANARLNKPRGLFWSGAELLIADRENNLIRRLSGNVVSTVAGSGTRGHADGDPSSAAFDRPASAVVDPNDGAIYIADDHNHVIRRLVAGVVSTYAGVAKTKGLKDGPRATAQFDGPFGLVLLPASTPGQVRLLVADTHNDRLRLVEGNTVSTVGAGGGFADGPLAQLRFSKPCGLAVDSASRVYVADTGNHRIRLIVLP